MKKEAMTTETPIPSLEDVQVAIDVYNATDLSTDALRPSGHGRKAPVTRPLPATA